MRSVQSRTVGLRSNQHSVLIDDVLKNQLSNYYLIVGVVADVVQKDLNDSHNEYHF